jgi:error-prone DNA polymerase
MVHPYLRRKEKLEPVDIPSPGPEFGPKDELEKVLGRTLGVPLFQEQAMQIAMVAAKFSAVEASKLRRSMATFQRTGEVKLFKTRFIEGMCNRGYPRKFVENCFKQIEGFGEYGFPESHAASFALLVYSSAWIKCHYPDVFLTALLNSQPMGFYATSQLVRDAQDHAVEVRPVDVNRSDWDCSLEHALLSKDNLHSRHAEMKGDILTSHAVRLGFRQIGGFSEDWGKKIENVRGRGFDSVRELWLRTGLPPKALKRLAHADAFNSLGLSRRDALWAVKALQKTGDKDNLPLFARVSMPKLEPDAHLPSMLRGEQVIEDYRHLHLSLKAHPISFLRRDFDARGIVRHELLPSLIPGRRATIGGIVLVRQRPGTGNTIFMTLEDETGIANTIVWPRKFEQYRPVVMGSRVISVTGVLQNEKDVIHIVADRFEDLTHLLGRLSEHGTRIDTAMPPDVIKRPVYSRQRHPRSGDALVTMLKEGRPVPENLTAQNTAQVMPKGRNFH